jgi:alpha-methylacyl-CoA racemase
MGERPAALSDVTILDLSTVGPATRCARILADYGARLIKVGVPPKKLGLQTQPAFWSYSAGRGMEQTRIDLKEERGKAAFLALVARADVVIESYRPGVMKKLGLAYDDLRAVNPRIILCATTGFGQDGPAARQAGHDINYLATGGFLHTSGRRGDNGPPLPGATVADSAAGGMHAAMAIMAALLRRAQTNEGEFLDVSVAEGVLWLESLYIDQHLATGETPGPGHDVLTGKFACYDTYACKDGKWISVGAIETRFFANLLGFLGLAKWAERQYDESAQAELRREMAAAFLVRTRDGWCDELPAADTCTAPVLAIDELVQNPQFVARGLFVDAEHPTEGKFRQLAPPLAGMNRAPGTISVPDGSKTDTDELLAEAGFTPNEISSMRADGVIG